MKTSSGEVLPCTEHLLALKPGVYTFVSMYDEKGAQRKTNVAGVIYAHAELLDCGEHALELEIENFPLPGSLRLIGVEKILHLLVLSADVFLIFIRLERTPVRFSIFCSMASPD